MIKSDIYTDNIYSAVKNTNKNLLIEAVAGSGKTTTLINILGLLNPTKTLFLAFNKNIAQEIKKRISSERIFTLNGFGFRQYLKNIKVKVRLDENKTDYILRNYVMKIPKGDKPLNVLFYRLVYPIKQLVSLGKMNLLYHPTRTDFEKLIEEYNVDMSRVNQLDTFYSYLFETYEKSIKSLMNCDFDDQIFVPLYRNWKIEKFDTVLVDEVQDLNLAQIELIKRASKRIIGVGDRNQAIYGFRGANHSSMDILKKELKAESLPMSVSYRCSRTVTEKAQEIVPHIQHREGADKGHFSHVEEKKFFEMLSVDDMVLCRVNYDMIKCCFRLLKENKFEFHIHSKKVKDKLLDIIKYISNYGNTDRIDIMMKNLIKYREEMVALYTKRRMYSFVQMIDDDIDTVMMFLQNSSNYKDIMKNIRLIFSEKTDGIKFSTIHGAKGLEADRVFLLRHDLIPHPKAVTESEKKEELNLKYVAITRAKKELYFVDVEETNDKQKK